MVEEIRRIAKQMIRDVAEDIRRALEEVEEALAMVRPLWTPDGCLEPLYTVYEYPDHYEVVVDMPRADMRTLSVEVRGNKLTLRCRLGSEVRFERWGTIQRHISFREYRMTLTLPEDADAEHMEVKSRGTMLVIRIPRR